MTTTIPSGYDKRTIEMEIEGSDVLLRVLRNGIHLGGARIPVGPLLDAVRSELGVLIIDKADLPAVEPERAGYSGYVGLDGEGSVESNPTPLLASADLHRQEALRHLALAEYIEAHPPVDEQQVEALVTLLNEHDVYRSQDASIIARALIRTGKVTVQS